MALMDLLGRRWALRGIWELRDDELNFRALQDRCGGISAAVLNDRLGELRDADIVAHSESSYGLTSEGRELLGFYGPLEAWAERWDERERRRAQQQGNPR